MRERVAELVRVKALNTGLTAAAPEHLCKARGG
jgi:hypothetical protein